MLLGRTACRWAGCVGFSDMYWQFGDPLCSCGFQYFPFSASVCIGRVCGFCVGSGFGVLLCCCELGETFRFDVVCLCIFSQFLPRDKGRSGRSEAVRHCAFVWAELFYFIGRAYSIDLWCCLTVS